MALEQIKCSNCGSNDVMEMKANTYACRACETIFKYQDPNRSEVAVTPQFCEEGCGNPIKYKCALCGKMVCEGHGEKAKVLLARRALQHVGGQTEFSSTTVPELQQAWCLSCSGNMSNEDAAAYIVLALQDKVRDYAALALKEIGDPSALPHLAQALNDTSPNSRTFQHYAILAIVHIGGPSAVPYLIQALEHSNAGARELGELGDPSAVPALIQAVNRYGNPDASKALGKFGDLSAVPALINCLKHSDWGSRRAAAEALGKFGDPSTVPALIQVLGSAEEGSYYGPGSVREAATEALVAIGTPAVPALVEALKEDNNYPRVLVVVALEKIGDPQGMAAVAKAQKRWAKRKEYKG